MTTSDQLHPEQEAYFAEKFAAFAGQVASHFSRNTQDQARIQAPFETFLHQLHQQDGPGAITISDRQHPMVRRILDVFVFWSRPMNNMGNIDPPQMFKIMEQHSNFLRALENGDGPDPDSLHHLVDPRSFSTHEERAQWIEREHSFSRVFASCDLQK